MKKFNICTKKSYKDRNGDEKTFWPNVGTMIYFPPSQEKKGGFMVELNMFPNTQFYCFEIKPKETRNEFQTETTQSNGDELDPSSIPF